MKRGSILLTLVLFVFLAISGTAGGQETGFKPHFTLRILGGPGYQSLDDLNSGSEGLSGIIILLPPNGAPSGNYTPVHFGLDLSVDLIYEFSPNWGIGIGTGFLRTFGSSSVAFTYDHPPYDVTKRFTIESTDGVVPIRPALFLFVPLGRHFRITLNAGPELLLASVSTDIRTEYIDWWWDQHDKASGGGFGFHVGIGLEAHLSSKLSLIVEAQGRYAKVGGLTGSHRYSNSRGDQETVEGTFYYWANSTYGTYHVPHIPFPLVGVQASLPSGTYLSSAREAVLDLSGGSIVAGFVFRF